MTEIKKKKPDFPDSREFLPRHAWRNPSISSDLRERIFLEARGKTGKRIESASLIDALHLLNYDRKGAKKKLIEIYEKELGNRALAEKLAEEELENKYGNEKK